MYEFQNEHARVDALRDAAALILARLRGDGRAANELLQVHRDDPRAIIAGLLELGQGMAWTLATRQGEDAETFLKRLVMGLASYEVMEQ